jgi:hypothetical protein
VLTRVFAPGFVFITLWCAIRTSVERGRRPSRVLREEERRVRREKGRRVEKEWREKREADGSYLWWCFFSLQIGVLEPMPEGKKGGRRVTKQGQQDCDRIAKEIWQSKQ